jgi:hypothetical protein
MLYFKALKPPAHLLVGLRRYIVGVDEFREDMSRYEYEFWALSKAD